MSEKEYTIIPINSEGQLVYDHWEALTNISKKILDAGITKLGSATSINLVILRGKGLGLDMFQALENITVINNKTCMSGSLASALVERSGLLIDKGHVYEGEPDTESRKCTVTVQRKGRKPVSWSFTLREAKKAGLYPGKTGSGWNSFSDSMLYWRALGFAYRREFPDVMGGMYLVEELSDDPPERAVEGRTLSASEVNIGPVPLAPRPPVDPDPDDPTASTHPLIAETAKDRKHQEGKPLVEVFADEEAAKAKQAQNVSPKEGNNNTTPEPVAPEPTSPEPTSSEPRSLKGKLYDLAIEAGISEVDLMEVIYGLRLSKVKTVDELPEKTITTLVKNFNVVVSQYQRMKAMKS